MNTRISILAAVSLFLLFLSAMFSLYANEINVLFILFLISLGVIAFTVWTNVEFNLAGKILFVSRTFREQEKFDLEHLLQWEELSYPIRGQRRRNLVMYFDQERTVELSNADFKDQYEVIYRYLKQEFSDIEKFNITALQEIKFNSMHNFLMTDFYAAATKYSQPNEEKNKKFSMQIFRMKIDGATQSEIARELFDFKTTVLSQHETISKCRQVADQIVETF